MDTCQKTLLELIKKSQFNTECELNYDDSVDWNEIYDEAVNQSVIGLILPEVPDEIIASDKRWTQIRDQQLAYYIRYKYAEDQLKKLLDSAMCR